MDGWRLVFEIVVLLAACLAGGSLLARLGQSPLVGYLLVGMVLGGPGSVGLVTSARDIEAIAELGVALLLFGLGLEFSWSRLKQLGRTTLLAGWVQVGATLLVGLVAVVATGGGLATGIAVGAMLALSSTAAVLRLLVERSDLDAEHGRASLAVLLVQDMAVVPLTLVLAFLGRGGTAGEILLDVGKTLGLAALFVVGLHLLLKHVIVRLLGVTSVERNREFAVLLAVVLGLGAAWGAHGIGISPALGAFAAGLFLGASPFATQVRADIASLRAVLLTLFFASVGMLADPLWIGRNLVLVLGVSTLVLVGKAFVTRTTLVALGKPASVAAATGLCLAQVGEFSFVLGKLGRDGGVVSDELYMLVVSVAMVTLLVTPWLVRAAPALGAWVARRRGDVDDAPDGESTAPVPEVLIVGFGPAGQAVGRALAATGRPAAVIELNAAARQQAIDLGLHCHVGDASSADVLEHAHAREARVIVITLPAPTAARLVLERARAVAPTAIFVVRSRYKIHAQELLAAGAHVVVGDETEVGTAMADQVLGLVAPIA
ncbi:MAG: cation:proton antiporter [Planctomycetota bacterium]